MFWLLSLRQTQKSTGFRRYTFLSEEYLATRKQYLDSIGVYNNQPLYRANNYITPRFKGKGSFRDYAQKDLDGYNIKKASYFLATFIVTAEGKVENVVVRSGITEGFDATVVKNLLKSSKDWTPARFNGKPVQAEMIYEIKYLKSISPFG